MELRHLRYFVAVVDGKGYREASRRLHITQPSISETISDLEDELGLKLFSRANRTVQLTPEGDAFYVEAVRTLEQAETAIVTAKRAAQGKIGRLAIGFIGSATLSFLPELICKYKSEYPDVRLTLQDLNPSDLESACDRGAIDIGITRTMSHERNKKFLSKVLFRDPLLAVLPKSRKLKGPEIRLADLANERFVIFHRQGSPYVFDTIVGACTAQGFSPRVENEPNSMQAVLSLVEAEEGVAIVPASTRNLKSTGVQFARLDPDNVRLDLIAAWPVGRPSVVLQNFLDFLDRNAEWIRRKADHGLDTATSRPAVSVRGESIAESPNSI
jgi:DNA-binding transcriptional LysR family regulator